MIINMLASIHLKTVPNFVFAFQEHEFYGNLSGKYYFNPVFNIDGFHVGGYIGGTESNLGIGFLLGYKFVAKSNILFEVGIGIGTNSTFTEFSQKSLGYGKLHVGYRFVIKEDAKVPNSDK